MATFYGKRTQKRAKAKPHLLRLRDRLGFLFLVFELFLTLHGFNQKVSSQGKNMPPFFNIDDLAIRKDQRTQVRPTFFRILSENSYFILATHILEIIALCALIVFFVRSGL